MENDASPRYVIICAFLLAFLLIDLLSQSSEQAYGLVESKSFGIKGKNSMEVKQERGGSYTYYVEGKILASLQVGKEVKIYKSLILRRTVAVEQDNTKISNSQSSINMLLYGAILTLGVFVGGYIYLLVREKSAS